MSFPTAASALSSSATLLIDGRPALGELLGAMLAFGEDRSSLCVAPSLAAALKVLERTDVSCVLLGEDLGDTSVCAAVDALERSASEVAIVALVDGDDTLVADGLLARGAQDVVATDSLTTAFLRHVIRGAVHAKQSQFALRRSEAWFRSLTENSADLIAVVDGSGNLLFTNEMGARSLGYVAQEQLGRNVFEFVHADDAGLVAERFATVRSMPGVDIPTRFRFAAGDGTWRWLETIAQNRLDDPLINGIVVNTRDITARVEAEELLKLAQARRSDRLVRNVEDLVALLAKLSEGHDPVCAGNQSRVAQLAAAIAAELDLEPEVAKGITVGASIHDLGVISVPASVLQRTGPLDASETALVQQHPQRGHDLVEAIDFPWPVADMILQHHERLDGSGYPAHLAGSSIGLGARVIGVADVVEAMSSPRSYRAALGIDAALDYVSLHAGTLFDASVVDACVRVFRARGFAFTSAGPTSGDET